MSTENAHGYDELHIGGIFPIAGKGGWQGGQACMPAARLALEDVNNQKDLLPGFRLTLHSNDSEVSRKLNYYIFFVFLFSVKLFINVFVGDKIRCRSWNFWRINKNNILRSACGYNFST